MDELPRRIFFENDQNDDDQIYSKVDFEISKRKMEHYKMIGSDIIINF
jgi:hypothetical protein